MTRAPLVGTCKYTVNVGCYTIIRGIVCGFDAEVGDGMAAASASSTTMMPHTAEAATTFVLA